MPGQTRFSLHVVWSHSNTNVTSSAMKFLMQKNMQEDYGVNSESYETV